MCTPYGKQEAVLIRKTCDVILSRSPRALWLAATACNNFCWWIFWCKHRNMQMSLQHAATVFCSIYCSIYFILLQTSAHVCNKCCNFFIAAFIAAFILFYSTYADGSSQWSKNADPTLTASSPTRDKQFQKLYHHQHRNPSWNDFVLSGTDCIPFISRWRCVCV